MKIGFFMLIGALLSMPAHAAAVRIEVKDNQGRPVPDAVVTIHPASGIPAGPIRFPWPTRMVQKDVQFVPGTLIVPVGATVTFPNQDKVRHHIYSFSKPARFEIKLFGRDETRSYTFKTAGAVALGCNIHDLMSGFIKVVDTPFAAKTGSAGYLAIDDVPAGAAKVTVWHPRMRAKDNQSQFDVAIPAAGTFKRQITVGLR
ncbi:cupredoxin domain-containing protein [Sphingomonas sp. CJ99]